MDSEALEFNLNNIEKIVQQFYKEPSNEKLNSFLTQAQYSKAAWSFCWDLLKVDKPAEVQYYGANTLHLKISKHWPEIPEQYVMPLRNGLADLLESHSSGSSSSRPVVVRICVCLGCLVLQTMHRQWPNALHELISSVFRPNRDDNNKRAIYQKNMLEILTYIPEELPSVVMSQTMKSQILNELIMRSIEVLSLIEHILVGGLSPEAVKIQAIRCLASWINLGLCMTEPGNERLVDLLFEHLRSPSCFAEVSEAIVHMFKCPDNKRHPRALLMYLRKVVELGPFFDAEQHDSEVTQSLTKIFISAAENSSELILSLLAKNSEESQTAIDVLNLVVKTVAIKGQYPTEETCSDLSFGFWYNFQDEVTGKQHPPHVVAAMKSLFLGMYDVMAAKTKYPPESDYSQWGAEDKEVFRCYRQDFADAAAYFSAFVGDASMARMHQLLTDRLTRLQNNESVDWQEFDSIIYVMTSILEGTNFEESLYTPLIYVLLQSVPCNHPTLITQIMFFIGSCAEIMDISMFQQSVDFILKGLLQEEISSAASMSLKDLLHANRDQIPMVAEPVLQVIKFAMERGDIEPSDRVRLANCVGLVLPSVGHAQAVSVIEVILMPHVRVLLDVANSAQFSGHGADAAVIQKAKLLAGFFSAFTMPEANEAVEPTHYIFQFLLEFLPCIKQIMCINIRAENIMNELFELLKRIVGSMTPHFGALVPEFCDVIATSYDLNPLPCVLDLAKTVFISASGYKTPQDVVIRTFISLCNKSLQILGDDPRNHPDVVEAFMNFLNQISKKVPALLKFEFESSFRLFNAAMVGIEMKENQASKSSCQFLSCLILTSDLSRTIEIQGTRLLEMLVLAIAVNLPRNNLGPLSEVFSALLVRHFEFMVRALNDVMSREPFPVASSTPADRQQFVKRVLSSQKCKRKLKETINEFALLWRGILNTEYAAQTSFLLN